MKLTQEVKSSIEYFAITKETPGEALILSVVRCEPNGWEMKPIDEYDERPVISG
ncbi:hypothetical protein ZHAS_00005260 [Anopheles sinensis]|uniref:Uncharacterized protein n=1 Tax=Anopheles sinensis TaxID=74873 RepID=A0A084VIZ2_ANOSI|nr:hypothetical protein ZHAS_00005260 [Anopheles sinensis]